MATLKEIRRKLQSVKNIQKITKAMEMVAASRLKKAQAKAERSRPYFNHLKTMLDNLISASEGFSHPLLDPREVNKTCFIIIAGDRGLCGSYNHNVFTTAENALQEYNKDQVELILIGKKTVDHFSKGPWEIDRSISAWGGKITYAEIKGLAEYLMDEYLTRHYDDIVLVYTHYISAISRKVVVEKLLKHDNSEKEDATIQNYIVEPGIAEILTELLPHYTISKIQLALYEAYASELAARVFSMRSATTNAREMIDSLTLIRNQLRQSSITRELVEITSCAESLK